MTSSPSAFSPLARTATTASVTLPGMPGPVTPEARSAVLVQAGWGSPASSDEEKLVDAACAGATSATALTTATVIDLRTSLLPMTPALPSGYDNVVIQAGRKLNGARAEASYPPLGNAQTTRC